MEIIKKLVGLTMMQAVIQNTKNFVLAEELTITPEEAAEYDGARCVMKVSTLREEQTPFHVIEVFKDDKVLFSHTTKGCQSEGPVDLNSLRLERWVATKEDLYATDGSKLPQEFYRLEGNRI